MRKHIFHRWKKTISLLTAIAGLTAGVGIAAAASYQPEPSGSTGTIPISDISQMNPHPIGYLDSFLPDKIKDIVNYHGFTEHIQDDGRTIYKPLHQDGTVTVNHVGSFTGSDGAEHPLSANITIPMTEIGGFDPNINIPEKRPFAFEFLIDGRVGLINVRVHLYSPDGTRIPDVINTGFVDLDEGETLTLGRGVTRAYVRSDNELKIEGDTFTGRTDSPNDDYLAKIAWQHYVGVDVNPDFEFTYGNPYKVTAQGTFFHPLIAQTSLHVTYDPNGGQGTKQDKLIVRDGNPYTLENNMFTRANYQFTGWNTKPDGTGDAYQPGKQIPIPEKNTTFYAQWKRSTTTISYSANGGTGSVPSHTGDIGSPVTIAGGFTRTGYDMTGYVGSDGKAYQVGQQVNQPDSDVELRAQWEKKHVTLTIQPNGASEQPVMLTYDYGDRALPAVPWRRDGYILTGLTRSPQGGDNVSELTMTDNTTLYAQWQAATHWYDLTPAHKTVYRVTLQPNGGDGSPVTADGHHGDTITIPQGGFTRTGYHTDGYSLTPDCAVKLSGNTVTLTDNMTVYQCWTVNTHQLTLNPNGGNGEPQVSTHNEGDNLTVPANPFQRDHYTFTGWTTTPDGGQPVSNLTMNSDTTLYAQWKKDTVTVTLDMNGGDGKPQVNTVDYGDQYTPNTRPTRDGYKFTGWNTTPDGSGVNVTTLTATANTTLYAQWKKAVPMTGLTPAHKTTHKLTISPNGGTGEPVELTGQHGDTVSVPDTKFTRQGYHKNGYSLTPDCTVKLDKPEVKLTTDTTVYQCWEKNTDKPADEQKPAQKPAEPAQKSAEPQVVASAKPEQKLASTGAGITAQVVASIIILLLLGTGFELARHKKK